MPDLPYGFAFQLSLFQANAPLPALSEPFTTKVFVV
jgi:hypothetical protein